MFKCLVVFQRILAADINSLNSNAQARTTESALTETKIYGMSYATANITTSVTTNCTTCVRGNTNSITYVTANRTICATANFMVCITADSMTFVTCQKQDVYS